MELSPAQLEAVIRDRICRVCTDRNTDGTCGMAEPSSCALFRLLPQVAAAVRSTDSNDIQDYIAAIRRDVCSICTSQDHEGDCTLRQEVQCALDAYLLLVVEAIEEATGKTFAREGFVQLPK
ncbi:MAG: hypothetical protein U0Q18_04890 [Bryobacteraceae bacterium]